MIIRINDSGTHPISGSETQRFTYAQQGSTEFYSQSMQGVYQGFFDLNVQAEWVHIDHVRVDDATEFDTLYLPFPILLHRATADKLRAWVAAGGTLIAEGILTSYRAGFVNFNSSRLTGKYR